MHRLLPPSSYARGRSSDLLKGSKTIEAVPSDIVAAPEGTPARAGFRLCARAGRRAGRSVTGLAQGQRLACALGSDWDAAEGQIEAEVVSALERTGDQERCPEPGAKRGSGAERGDRPGEV